MGNWNPSPALALTISQQMPPPPERAGHSHGFTPKLQASAAGLHLQ